jgi:hypothetical protein
MAKTQQFEDRLRTISDQWGYRDGEGVNRRWYVFPEVFKDTFCEGLDPDFVALTLRKYGMLETDPDRLTKVVKVKGQSQRFYAITAKILEDIPDENLPTSFSLE